MRVVAGLPRTTAASAASGQPPARTGPGGILRRGGPITSHVQRAILTSLTGRGRRPSVLLLSCTLLLAACSRDADGDGYEVDVDCDDANARVHPDAVEVCNGFDDNCDDAVDDADPSVDVSTGRRFFADVDQDGFGDPNVSVEACAQPQGYVDRVADCDDTTVEAHPDAVEVCDGIDNDCDALVDDADDSLDTSSATMLWVDADSDGHGWSATSGWFCVWPEGYVDLDDDCDDEDASIYPGAPDPPQDGIDQDCNGEDAPYTLADLIEGDLIITEIQSDPDTVDNAMGQWFEVYNHSGGRLVLDGLYVTDEGEGGFSVGGALEVDADDYVVLGNNSDTATNGGVPMDYGYGSAMPLGAGTSRIVLADGTDMSRVFDEVAYGEGTDIPQQPGVSAQLSDRTWGAIDNDDAKNWCPSTSSYGDGDLGSPGSDNAICPYNVGNDEPFGRSGRPGPDLWLGSQIVLDQPATLDKFGIIVTYPSGRYRMALYTDAHGNPHMPVTETGAQTQVAGRQEIDVPDVELAAGTYYILVIYEGFGSPTLSTETDATVWFGAGSFGTAAPAPFGPADTYSGQEFSYYIGVY